MQVDKVIATNIKKLSRVDEILKDAFKKDIKTLLHYVFDKYDVYENGQAADKAVVLGEIIAKFAEPTRATTMCCAVTAQGMRCSKTSTNNTNYCKLHRNHVYKDLFEEKVEEHVIFYDVSEDL